MIFAALYTTLKARKSIVLTAVAAGLVVAVAAGLLLPPRYESTARVLVDSIQKNNVTGVYEPRLRVSEFLGQQAAIAGSRTVAVQTIETLSADGVIAMADFEERWRRETGGELRPGNDAKLWAADELLKYLVIQADALEGTLSISFRGENPVQAAQLANAFASAYMTTVLEQRQRRAARNAATFSEERRILERDLQSAQSELSAFREERGIVALGAQRLETAEVELAALTARLGDARADDSEMQSLLRQAQGATPTELLTIPLPEDVLAGRQAQARLGVVTAQLQRLAERYGPTYPDYVEVVNEKAALEASIMQAIVDRANFAQRRVAALEATMAGQKSGVVALQDTKQAYDILDKKVSVSRDAYDLVANRTLQESLQSRMDDFDVVLLARAVPPAHPMTPPLIVIMLLGVIAGFLLGACGAVALELVEGRVRDAAAVRHLLRAPVLAEIDLPRPPKRSRKAGSLSFGPKRRPA